MSSEATDPQATIPHARVVYSSLSHARHKCRGRSLWQERIATADA